MQQRKHIVNGWPLDIFTECLQRQKDIPKFTSAERKGRFNMEKVSMKKCSLCGSHTRKLYGSDKMCMRCWRGFQDYLNEVQVTDPVRGTLKGL